MKKLRFALLLGVVCAAALSVAVSAHGIRSYERELLEHELTRCYPEANLAERTGICAVVLHRLDDPRYPDSPFVPSENFRPVRNMIHPLSG